MGPALRRVGPSHVGVAAKTLTVDSWPPPGVARPRRADALGAVDDRCGRVLGGTCGLRRPTWEPSGCHERRPAGAAINLMQHPLALRLGPGPDDSVRGVNVMRVVDGKMVEAAGYSKTAPIVAALES